MLIGSVEERVRIGNSFSQCEAPMRSVAAGRNQRSGFCLRVKGAAEGSVWLSAVRMQREFNPSTSSTTRVPLVVGLEKLWVGGAQPTTSAAAKSGNYEPHHPEAWRTPRPMSGNRTCWHGGEAGATLIGQRVESASPPSHRYQPDKHPRILTLPGPDLPAEVLTCFDASNMGSWCVTRVIFSAPLGRSQKRFC